MITHRIHASLVLVCLVAVGLAGCTPGAVETVATMPPTSSASATPSATPAAPPAAAAFETMDPADFAMVVVDQSLLDDLGETPNGVHFLVPEADLACSLWSGTFGSPTGVDFAGMRWGCHKGGEHWPTEMVPPDPAFCVEGAACLVNGVRADGDGVAAGFVVADAVFPAQWGRDPAVADVATLGDGQQVSAGDVTCQRSGVEVTCTNAASGHGFSASGVEVSWW